MAEKERVSSLNAQPRHKRHLNSKASNFDRLRWNAACFGPESELVQDTWKLHNALEWLLSCLFLKVSQSSLPTSHREANGAKVIGPPFNLRPLLVINLVTIISLQKTTIYLKLLQLKVLVGLVTWRCVQYARLPYSVSSSFFFAHLPL